MSFPFTLEDRIDEYLQELHCELWPAETFYISQPADRAEAINWLAALVRAVDH